MTELAAGFRLIKSVTVPLTKELAREFRDLPASPTERDTSEKRLGFLREKVDAGLLVTFQWARANYQGRWVRVNGQHSSKMLCELNGSFPEGLNVHCDDYEVDDEEGLANLFRQFDPRLSGRTPADVAGAYQMLQEPLQSLHKPTAKMGIEGIAWYKRHVLGTSGARGDDVYELFTYPEFHPFLIWFCELFSVKTPELKRPPIVGALYATHDGNRKEAETFWNQVARGGEEYADDAPSTVLDTWLKKAIEKDGTRKPIKQGEFYQGCKFAWDAHRAGKKIKSIRYDTSKGLTAPNE